MAVMPSAAVDSAPQRPIARASHRVLNVGSGHSSIRRLHPTFRSGRWEEVRLDVDPAVEPDVIGSIVDLKGLVESGSFDAVWASHSLEHLRAHEAPLALAEIRRVLKPDGFAVITSPDLETVAKQIVEHGLDYVAYVSPMGPITLHDIVFGHTVSIQRGAAYMEHHCGFTCQRLGQLLLEAGFPVVLGKRQGFDIWLVALMEKGHKSAVQRLLWAAGLDMYDEATDRSVVAGQLLVRA